MREIKKMFYKAFFCLFVLQIGSSVFAAKKQNKVIPEWINSPSSVYPSDNYITYVGSSADRNAAEVNALKGIASVFGQSVKSEQNASSRMIQAKENGMLAQTSNIQTFSQDIKRFVDTDNLIGVEIKEFWFDNENSIWYAIAILDKTKATDIYTTMIKKNSIALSSLKKHSEEDLYSFEGFAAYDFAEDIAKENENHLKKISVIKPEDVSSLKSYCPSSNNIYARKMEIAKNIPICVTTVNDDQGRFKEAFYQAIANCGFKGSYDDSSRYILIAKFEFEKSETTDKKTVRCRYYAESYIFDTKTNHQIVPFTTSGRESHVEYSEARVKAEKKLESKIKSEFKETFSNFLKNLVIE